MLVRECLHNAPVTVPPACTISEAAELMGRHGVGSLLVVSGDRLLGIVTDRDVTVRGVGRHIAVSDPVSVIMTKDPLTIQGSDDIVEAFRVIKDANARRLPVLEGTDLAGIITVDDLLVALVLEFNEAMAPIVREVVSPEIPT
jgi:CBS domain-containing protein